MKFYNKMDGAFKGTATFKVFNSADAVRIVARYAADVEPGKDDTYMPSDGESFTVKVDMPGGGQWAYDVPAHGDKAWVSCNGTNDISQG